MNILEAYKKFQIMPQLAEHQLCVAAVGEMICDNISVVVNKVDVVTALLLHDMGNIIKFDLTLSDKLFPGLFTQQDAEYWQSVQAEYKAKYGPDEHHASLEIARELGVGERVVELMDCIGFNTDAINVASLDIEKKICAYSDMRVWPQGITSLEHRLADLRARYEAKFHQVGGNEERRLSFENGMREAEKQIFSRCSILPGDIMDIVIAPRKGALKSFQI
jgi:hypothetical protein